MHMAVDSSEEEWTRLEDIKLKGYTLEYTGRAKRLEDVGLAQARRPLDTTHHYFEIEILDPGEDCFITIGLARRSYPKYRQLGWNKESIAYHADDGKIYVSSRVGIPFGPRCNKGALNYLIVVCGFNSGRAKLSCRHIIMTHVSHVMDFYLGDRMGCGILFPTDYDSEAECGLLAEDGEKPHDGGEMDDNYHESDTDEEDLYEKDEEEGGLKVNIFFTRNGTIIGQREFWLPKSGLFPTVGMFSFCEKVRVDLRPLTG